ncbi:hypothetical protein [Pseudomonas denitrificans (nom. rej.)]|uniref:hypothetical protein n=1 Tax=Pseudomonas denitrificans TaxID=43306 RepID=UPI0015810DA6|nr:hypothetical protein [Pseudomonas denitrificans (nom. rej.)]
MRDLFVNFSEVTDVHVGKFKGFWGDIQDIRLEKNNESSINTGNKEDVSVLIRQRICAPFLSYHRIKWSELEGMHFLVFGWLNRGGENNQKLWIRPEGVEFTAIYEGF